MRNRWDNFWLSLENNGEFVKELKFSLLLVLRCNYSFLKYTKVVYNIQRVWHSPNTLPSIDHGRTFHIYCESTFTLGFYKMHWSPSSWICGSKHYRQQSMEKFNFIGYLFSWFKWTTKSVKIRIPWLIMISQ